MKLALLSLLTLASIHAVAKAQSNKPCPRCVSLDAAIAKNDVDSSSALIDQPLSKDPEIAQQEADAITRAAVKFAKDTTGITQEIYCVAYRVNKTYMKIALAKQTPDEQRMLKGLLSDYARALRSN